MFCSQIFNFNDFVWDSGSLIDEGSVFEHVEKRMDSSSASSDCHVDTTTGNGMDSKPGWKGFWGLKLWPGILFTSLTINFTFICVYLYYNLEMRI
ncbi:hypothetical protein cypCar_00019060 [Cyprinus carpio]|nr:hypothetical protein cypCar_00019060 [Cyprinus carpio]